jgi:hypothetical protein
MDVEQAKEKRREILRDSNERLSLIKISGKSLEGSSGSY